MKKRMRPILGLLLLLVLLACLAMGCTAPAGDGSEAAADSAELLYQFRSDEQYDQHYAKHGDEFGDITQEQYLAGANALIQSPDALTKTEDDGDALFYDEDANEFAVLSGDGFIRTYFRPDDGIDYWNRQ